MGSMSTDTGFDPSTADMVLSDDDFTLDLDEDQADSFANVLNSTEGSSKDPVMDDDDLDFSNPTRDGATPLESNFFDDFDFDKALEKASGLGGKGSGPESLGSGGALRTVGEKKTKGRGFGKIMGDSTYQAPSYYSPQGSVVYQGMTRELIKGLLSNSIRKPTIRSLV